jgi:uncharacterized membrane protein YhaH (DUF805 family)
MFVLFNIAIGFILRVVDDLSGISAHSDINVLSTLYGLAVLIPGIAVSVRRLHNTGRSAWWLLIGIVPIIGVIVLFVFMVQDSQPGTNRYGPNPKAATT